MSLQKESNVNVNAREKKYFGKFRESLAPIPNLVKSQVDSFQWLMEKGLKEVFSEFSSIKDYSEKKFQLDFTGFELSEPKYNEYYAKDNKLSYEAPLKVKIRLKNLTLNTTKEQEIFMADFPLMTSHGTFIITGIERVIVPQLARSYGVFFTSQEVRGKRLFGAKIIPLRGAWVEIESDLDGMIYVRIDRKRKFAATVLLRVLGAKTDADILELFEDDNFSKVSIEKTLLKDHAKTIENAFIEIHKRLRDGDLATAENAKEFVTSIFDTERYDLSVVGRHMFNKRFGKKMDDKELKRKTSSLEDIVTIIKNIALLNK